jgi:hypothetical protein
MSSILPVHAESTCETIKVMRRLEEMLYNLPSQVVVSSSPPADVSCRLSMAQWCYQIVDHCHFQRETVAVTMNYLDRFLASHDGQTRVLPDRQQFQLAAMSCLYTAVKIHEHEAVTPRLIVNLSNGAHSTTDVEAMEVRILKALTWAVNLPTSSAFVINLWSSFHHPFCRIRPCEPQRLSWPTFKRIWPFVIIPW